jgi:peptide-methionine (R)-S-oxide reductase
MKKTEKEWREVLTPEQYAVCREKGTERPFTGQYWNAFDEGIYKCVACDEVLFVSETKFDAGCGWPSFDRPIEEEKIGYHEDNSYGMRRVEVTCKACGAHLGHVFTDGPTETGQRYCINSVSLTFEEKK